MKVAVQVEGGYSTTHFPLSLSIQSMVFSFWLKYLIAASSSIGSCFTITILLISFSIIKHQLTNETPII